MAPSTPAVQGLVASSLGLEWQVVGAISESKFVVANGDLGRFEAWEASGTGVTQLATSSVTFSYGQFSSMNGQVAYYTPGSGRWHFFSDGSPWTTDLSVNLTFGASQRMYVAGDASEAVGSDGTNVFGAPMDGTTTVNWWCALGTGILVGAPRRDRWLRMYGDDAVDGMTVELMDDTGSALDSVTFTHPAGSWYNAVGGSTTEADSLLWWTQTAQDVNTYVGSTRAGGPTYAVTVHHRTLITTGDTLAWNAAEATFDPDWTESSALDHFHPYATSWDGQLAVGYRRDIFT